MGALGRRTMRTAATTSTAAIDGMGRKEKTGMKAAWGGVEKIRLWATA
jgi:hypothetical protein